MSALSCIHNITSRKPSGRRTKSPGVSRRYLPKEVLLWLNTISPQTVGTPPWWHSRIERLTLPPPPSPCVPLLLPVHICANSANFQDPEFWYKRAVSAITLPHQTTSFDCGVGWISLPCPCWFVYSEKFSAKLIACKMLTNAFSVLYSMSAICWEVRARPREGGH